jgi:hypothetical protein
MKWLFSLAIVLTMVLSGCMHYGVPPNVQYYFKSKSQLRATEREALGGDNVCARRMADYYYFARNDRGLCVWWLKLAASRGDSVARENLRGIERQ